MHHGPGGIYAALPFVGTTHVKASSRFLQRSDSQEAVTYTLGRLPFSVDSSQDFVIQAKADCYFTNGTEKVRFVVRFIFNLEEYLHFDSDLGMFVALTELGEPDAEQWNKRWDLLEQSRASVNMVCRQNYKLGAPFTVGRNGRDGEIPDKVTEPWHQKAFHCPKRVHDSPPPILKGSEVGLICAKSYITGPQPPLCSNCGANGAEQPGGRRQRLPNIEVRIVSTTQAEPGILN
ncbi:hypothetical protein A6R68_21813 [Neotoma lepida]|uniref:MHC class II beta chain N-terminal domain-containing protein n=1 Tax=Neotoma lepida TaxID=56216 RepID=A0A1A6HQI4_NEOLE|nr:hypothetical protein A6R68_21813 [Neotoma lepida]